MKQILAPLIGVILCSCSTVKRISPEEFEQEYSQAKNTYAGSMGDYNFTGMSEDGNVYLHRDRMSLLGLFGLQSYHDYVYISHYSLLSPEVQRDIKGSLQKQLQTLE